MTTNISTIEALLTPDALRRLFPEERADQFFEALLGDAQEGAYDIRLAFDGYCAGQLHFNLELLRRPGKCLACNLTYGLPTVFSRHPTIDIKGIVAQIDTLIAGHGRCGGWKLGATRELSPAVHVVPLAVDLQSDPVTDP